MKEVEAHAADYWLENTERIYAEDLHVSGPVMDAFRAGFEKAKQLAVDRIRYARFSIVLADDGHTRGYVNACKQCENDVKTLGDKEYQM